MKKLIALLLVIGIVAGFAYYGGYLKTDEQKIEDRMNDFLKAYNSGDFNGALESFDSKTRNTYKSVMNIGNALIGLTGFGVDVSDLFTLGVSLSEGDLLQFDELQITFLSDTKATVSTIMYYQGYQESYSKKVQFTLIKEDNDWYICK